MRKNYKKKKKACGLCKPHKRGWQKRWKERELEDREKFEKDKHIIFNALGDVDL